MKSKPARIIDTIFVGIVLCFAIFIVCRQFVDLYTSIILAITILVCLGGLSRIRRHKAAISTLSKQEKAHMEECFFHLMMCPSKERIEFFAALFGDIQSYTKSGFLTNSSHLYIIALSPLPITEAQIYGYISTFLQSKASQLHLVTTLGVPPQSTLILKSCLQEFVIHESGTLYKQFVKKQLFPIVTIQRQTTKAHRHIILDAFFAPSNIRKFLFASVILFLYAYFLHGSIYYLLTGFACLSLSVICKMRSVIRGNP